MFALEQEILDCAEDLDQLGYLAEVKDDRSNVTLIEDKLRDGDTEDIVRWLNRGIQVYYNVVACNSILARLRMMEYIKDTEKRP